MDYSKHIQKAEEAARRRNYDFAVQLYQQLLEIDPDVGEARAGLRRVLKKRHEAKQGGKLLGFIKGAAPLAMAKTLIKAKRYAAAAKSLESYLATAPLNEEANMLLGTTLEAAGHFDSALAVYEFITEIAPKNPEGLKRAGAMMQKKGDVQKALDYYERALDADPRDQEAIKARKDLSAEAALSKARYADVEHSREQIKDKQEAQSLERAGRMHRSQDELREELERLEERYAESPSDVELMVAMSEVHEKLRDSEAALDLIERALSYRRDSVDLKSRHGQLKLKALKKAIARADKEGDAHRADQLEAELRSLEIDELESRIELTPGDLGLHLELGRTLFRQERFDEAAAELQKAAGDPRLADDARFVLAQCFQKKGFMDLAKKEYHEALDDHSNVDERAREILYNLGAIAEVEGDSTEARSCYARIYAVDIGFRDVASKMEQLK